MTHSYANNLNTLPAIWSGLSMLSPRNRCADAFLCLEKTKQIHEQDFNYIGMM